MYSPTPTIADRTGLSEIPLPDSVKVQFHTSSGNGKSWERGKLECLNHVVVVSHAVVLRKFATPLQNHSRCRCTEQHSFFYVSHFCNHCCYAYRLHHDAVDGNLYRLWYWCSQLLLLEMVGLKWMLIPNQHVRHHIKTETKSSWPWQWHTYFSIYMHIIKNMRKVYKYHFKYVFYILNGWTQEKTTSNSPCFSQEAVLLDFTSRKKKERKKKVICWSQMRMSMLWCKS